MTSAKENNFLEKQSVEKKINLSECNKHICEETSENTRTASYSQENLDLNSQSGYKDCFKDDQSLLPTNIDHSNSLYWETDTMMI